MAMNLETKYPQAFDRLRQAQASLAQFKRRKDKKQLELANQFISEAIDIDPQYLRAFYYRGMVNDMLGHAVEAVKDFELVLSQNPPFLEEVKYNLGVAYFHRYGQPNLKIAIQQFEAVVESAENPSLRLSALAGITHAYAVMMIPRPKQVIEDCREYEEFLQSSEARDHVAHYYNLSAKSSSRLARELEDQEGLPDAVTNEIKWRLCNTRAVQRMFYTDYFDDNRIEKLKEAETALVEADRRNPNYWSIYCNMGSTYMRLGYWLSVGAEDSEVLKEAVGYFNKAVERLGRVIEELLPNYGFALYELGRVYRLSGNFEQALIFFDQAREIPERDRAVSDRTLRCERERAENESTDFPFVRG